MEPATKLRTEIEAQGGTVERHLAPSTRVCNPTSLVEALRNALGGRSLTVDEATVAVLEAGYRSNSQAFRHIVNQMLVRSPEFRRVQRGVYTHLGVETGGVLRRSSRPRGRSRIRT